MISVVVECALAALLFIIPIGLTLWVTRTPNFLAPVGKLATSLIFIAAGAVIPLFFPRLFADFRGTSPLIVAIIFSAVALPQGFMGAALALWLTTRKTDRHTTLVSAWWWSLSLLGITWSTYVVLATGFAYANW